MAIPGTPQNVILQTGNGQNLVSWDLTATATSYTVQRGTDGVNFTTVSSPSVNSYIDSAVSVGGTYFYQVLATNGSGSSAYTASYPPSITPCLPGQINLGYLRYMSQLRADKLNSYYLTTDEWNFNINQSVTELYDILTCQFGEDYFFATPLIISLTGALSYPMPDGSNYPIAGVPSPALFKLNGVDVNLGGGNASNTTGGWVPLCRANWSDRNKFSSFVGQAIALNNAAQLSYREMGNQLYLLPPATNSTIRLWYVPILTQLLADSDMLPFSISGWSEYVINDAAKKAMIKEESLEKWQTLDNANAILRERIETTAANRDIGQVNSVSNVRATMSDPGFNDFGYGGGGFGGGGGFSGGW